MYSLAPVDTVDDDVSQSVPIVEQDFGRGPELAVNLRDLWDWLGALVVAAKFVNRGMGYNRRTFYKTPDEEERSRPQAVITTKGARWLWDNAPADCRKPQTTNLQRAEL